MFKGLEQRIRSRIRNAKVGVDRESGEFESIEDAVDTVVESAHHVIRTGGDMFIMMTGLLRDCGGDIPDEEELSRADRDSIFTFAKNFDDYPTTLVSESTRVTIARAFSVIDRVHHFMKCVCDAPPPAWRPFPFTATWRWKVVHMLHRRYLNSTDIFVNQMYSFHLYMRPIIREQSVPPMRSMRGS